MATGLGKSLVANQLVVSELERNPMQEVLVLAHMTDLVRQLEQSSWSQLEKTYSTHLWTDGETPSYSGGVIFATWQSVVAATILVFPAISGDTDIIHSIKVGYPVFWTTVLVPVAMRLGHKCRIAKG